MPAEQLRFGISDVNPKTDVVGHSKVSEKNH